MPAVSDTDPASGGRMDAGGAGGAGDGRRAGSPRSADRHASGGGGRGAAGRPEVPDASGPGRSRPGRAVRGALLGGAVALGWIQHDLVTFLTSGEPRLALEILPGSLALVLAVALLGLVLALGPRALLPALLAAAAAGAALPPLLDLSLPYARLWLPRALLLGTALALGAWLLAGRLGRGLVVLGLVAGVLGSALHGLWIHAWMHGSTQAAAGAALALGALALRTERQRSLAALVLVLAPIALVARHERPSPFGERADLPPPSAPARELPSLLLVVLDTVRADRLEAYGYGRATMPGLAAFAAEHCVRYDDARSTTSWTLPSHASLFTGLLPGEHGATHPRGSGPPVYPGHPLRDDVPTLAEVLREEGYRTGAVIANSFALRHALGLDRGFERYDDRPGAGVAGYMALVQLVGHRVRVGHELSRDARTITDRALSWIDDLDGERPFFLFLNYLDAHWPYLPPPPYDRAFGDEQPADPLAPGAELHSLLYDRELLWLDSQLTRLFDGLRARGLLERSVVIVTSDHGESFGERGFWKHDWTLYEETIRVPLFVKPVGPRPAASLADPVTGADVPRMALEALGLPATLGSPVPGVVAEWYHMDGAGVRAVSPGGDSPPPPPELVARMAEERRDLLAWIEDGRKVVVSSAGEVEVYDLARDPGELTPLPLLEEERAAWLARAREWWASHPPLGEAPDVAPEELDAWRAQGRDLGYAGGED